MTSTFQPALNNTGKIDWLNFPNQNPTSISALYPLPRIDMIGQSYAAPTLPDVELHDGALPRLQQALETIGQSTFACCQACNQPGVDQSQVHQHDLLEKAPTALQAQATPFRQHVRGSTKKPAASACRERKSRFHEHLDVDIPYVPEQASQASKPAALPHMEAAPAPAPPRRHLDGSLFTRHALVLYDYSADPTDKDEVSLKRGDKVKVAKTTEYWCLVRTASSEDGLAPTAHLRLMPISYVARKAVGSGAKKCEAEMPVVEAERPSSTTRVVVEHLKRKARLSMLDARLAYAAVARPSRKG